MYNSTSHRNIVLSICPNWAGELDIYNPSVKAIELGVSILNKSKEDLKIDHISLRIKKNSFLFYSYEDLPINNFKQVISPDLKCDFIYDLKPVLALYGNHKKIHFRIVSGSLIIESKPVSIKEIHDDLISIYARHF